MIGMAQHIDTIISVLVGLYAIALGFGVKLQPEKFRGKKYVAAMGVVIIIGGLATLLSQRGPAPVIRPDATEIVIGMKKKLVLPAEVDRQTRLDDVKANKEKIIYLMTVLSPREDALNRTGFLRVFLHEQACTSPTYLTLLQTGFTVVVDYRDLDGKELDTVTLEPKECGFPQ